ncbi:MAG: glycoside hydrolase family 16 protein [Methylocella sp.]
MDGRVKPGQDVGVSMGHFHRELELIQHLEHADSVAPSEMPSSRQTQATDFHSPRKIVRTILLSGAIVAVSINCLALSGPPTAWAELSSACETKTATEYTMVIQSPCSPTIVKANQTLNPSLLNIAITDTNATVHPAIIPVQVQAPGIVNVEIWTHNKMATLLVNDGTGTFRGQLDLSSEPNGPIVMAINAWNTPPGDNSYTVNLAAMMTLFVIGGEDAVIPTPVAAQEMNLQWSDEFNSLSAIPCKPGTGTWPKCTRPTASDGFTWYENKPNGGDFGDAAFEHTDSHYNPYTIKNGFLRIRSQYDPNYADPNGYGRHWYSGLLASAFPDGTTNAPGLANGYYEARILVPNAATSDKSKSGGTWPAFWMMDLHDFRKRATGSLEVDITEEYGHDPYYTQSGIVAYRTATGGGWIYHAHPGPDLTCDFHRHGLLVTDTAVTYYFDDQPIGSAARPALQNNPPVDWFLMLDLAMGSGWPVNPPPAGYFDMWIDYVKYYVP